MPVRVGKAEWSGTLWEGRGQMVTATGVCGGPYSAGSRFEESRGTNPEELIAAAHAGCFSMQLADNLAAAGHPASRIATQARVHIAKVGDGFSITRIDLSTDADVPGIDEAAFQRAAQAAKAGCPVSRALAAVPEITLEARLTPETGAQAA